MADCTDQIENPPAVAPSITDRNACKLFRVWEAEKFFPWLISSFPKICASVWLADKLYDATKFKGTYDQNVVYNLGESVVYNGELYVSLSDNNPTTPPNSSWYKLSADVDLTPYLKKTGGIIDGELTVRAGDREINLKENDITLYARKGSADEKSVALTLADDGSQFSINPFAGSTQKEGLSYDFSAGQWDIGGYKNPLFATSTTPTNRDPNGVVHDNPDDIYIVTNHTNTPDSAHYWHIRTQFLQVSDNCSQIAIQHNGGAKCYVRSRYNGTWTAWQHLVTGKPGAWLTLSLVNGFTGNLYYRKQDDHTVEILGSVRNTSGSSSWTMKSIGTLPAGYRPDIDISVHQAVDRNDVKDPRLLVRNTGAVETQTVGDHTHYIHALYKVN